MTLVFSLLARNCGAPAELWRNTIISACNASRLRAVSLSVSPLVRLDVVAAILITSALSRNAASSKEVRVRVLGSTKKLTSVLPRNAGTFLISRVPTCLNASVVSRTKLISSAVSSRRPSKSLRVQRVVMIGTSTAAAMAESAERTLAACWFRRSVETIFRSERISQRYTRSGKFAMAECHRQHAASVRSPESSFACSLLFQVDAVRFVVGFLKTHLNLFSRRGRQIFADVIGTNRQFAMAAID